MTLVGELATLHTVHLHLRISEILTARAMDTENLVTEQQKMRLMRNDCLEPKRARNHFDHPQTTADTLSAANSAGDAHFPFGLHGGRRWIEGLWRVGING